MSVVAAYAVASAASLLVIYDGFKTRKAIKDGHIELNPVRRAIIKLLGPDLGTVGVSVVTGIGLIILALSLLPQSPITALTVFIPIMTVYAYATLR